MSRMQVDADVIRGLLTNVDNMTKGVEALRDEIKTQGKELGVLKGLNVEATLKEFEKSRAQMEQFIARHAKQQARFLGMPGAEDERSKFSIVRAAIAIKTGDWDKAAHEKSVLEEARSKASQVADVGSRGGWFIPDYLFPEVIGAIYAASAFINLNGAGEGQTRVTVIDGVPSVSGSMSKVRGGCVSYWVGEEDNAAESAMAAGDITYNLKCLACMVRITQKMRDYQGLGFESALRNDMIRSFIQKLDKTIPYGSGSSHMPLGFVKAAGVKMFSAKDNTVKTTAPSAANNTGGELTFDVLDEMMGVLEDANFMVGPSAAFIFHPRARRWLRQLRIENYTGQQGSKEYLTGFPRLPDARLQEIIGPFGMTTQIPVNNTPGKSAGWSSNVTATKSTDVFYANWADVVLVRGVGINIESDDGKGKGFVSGHTYTKLYGYFDTLYRYPESIVVCPDARVYA